MFREMLQKGVAGETFSREEAYSMMSLILDGHVTEAELSSLLTVLRFRGETVDELTGFAECVRERATKITHRQTRVIDTCGTGGDGSSTFNISTVSAIILSSLDIKVAKHGNSAVTSKSGSADVLRELRISVPETPDEASRQLEQHSLCFLFAPIFHPSLKFAGPTRKKLSFRTAFNLLGPLCNPAFPTHQLIGAFNERAAKTISEAALNLGLNKVVVVSGLDGLDECSISAPTRFYEVNDGRVRTYTLTPEDVGLTVGKLEDITVSSISESAKVILSVLAGNGAEVANNIVAFNAGVALYASDYVSTIQEGVKMVKEILRSGTAFGHYESIRGEQYAATNS